MKKLPLLLLLASSTTFAGSLSNTDARSMAMGDVGVAASKPGTAGLFNPALLSTYTDGEKISLIFADFAGSLTANQDTFDSAEDIVDGDFGTQITDAVDLVNQLADGPVNTGTIADFGNATSSLANITNSFNEALGNISGEALTMSGNMLIAGARPSKDLGIGLYFNVGGTIETGLDIALCDQQLLTDFAGAIEDLTDLNNNILNNPGADIVSTCDGVDRTLIDGSTGDLQDPDGDLSSGFIFALIQQTEVGLSLSRKFRVAGHNIAFGITPKFITLTSHLVSPSLQDIDDETYDLTDEFNNNEKEDSNFDIDVGVAASLLHDDSLKVGIVIKNLLAPSFDTISTATADIDTTIRAGIAWSKAGFSFGADLDLVENDGFLGSTKSQFAAFGGEYNLFNTLRLRGGIRSNLSETDETALTAGIGFNIIAAHCDFALQYSNLNLGLALQLGLEF
ncbi:MAG: conjugal transfer protein TraF [Pseudomonadales bacterium]|nr:conjugal transfer protein TraF [Pseudomonadales bacterium]